MEAAEDLGRLLGGIAYRDVDGDEAWSVQVAFGDDSGKLASILRRAEEWVAARGLLAIRFGLDGRWYVLESGEATWALEAA